MQRGRDDREGRWCAGKHLLDSLTPAVRFEHGLRQLFDKERDAIRPFDDLGYRVPRQCRAPGNTLHHSGGVAAVESGERDRHDLRRAQPRRRELRAKSGDKQDGEVRDPLDRAIQKLV